MRRLAMIVGVLAGLGLGAADAAEAPQNYGQAMAWYERAAAEGNPRAQFYLGVMLETGIRGDTDPAAAVQWYRKAAAQGHVEAQFKLGLMHYQGIGVGRDLPAAARWYRSAAAGGSAEARYNLALMYERGVGVKRDIARAATLFAEAADGGATAAAYSLSVLYARGIGIGRDLGAALMWLDVALATGLGGSEDYRKGLVEALPAATVAEAERQAAERVARMRAKLNPLRAPAPGDGG